MADRSRKSTAYRPVIGFLLAVCIGVIAWLAAPAVIGWLADMLPVFRGNELPLSASRTLFTALIVMLALILFALLAALTAPRNKDAEMASTAKLESERHALRRREKAERADARKPKGMR